MYKNFVQLLLTRIVCSSVLCIVFTTGINAQTQNNSSSSDSTKKTTPVVQNQKSTNTHEIVLQEQKIEGKIRRPQLVLIKADERPVFGAMVMQSVSKTKISSVLEHESVLEDGIYHDPFQFDGTKVVVNSK